MQISGAYTRVILMVYYTVKLPIAEHTADTEQFPWSQHAPLTYRRFQLRNNFLLGAKNLVPNPFLNWSFYCNLKTWKVQQKDIRSKAITFVRTCVQLHAGVDYLVHVQSGV